MRRGGLNMIRTFTTGRVIVSLGGDVTETVQRSCLSLGSELRLFLQASASSEEVP